MLVCPKEKIIIYSLTDPITNEIRYIGKTTQRLNSRLSSHINVARKEYKKDHCHCWIKGLLNKGLKPLCNVIEIADNVEREVYWIKYYKENGNITNHSPGGDLGNLGLRWKLSEDKISVKYSKKVYIFSLNGTLICTTSSLKEFANKYKLSTATASKYIKHNYRINNIIPSYLNIFPITFKEKPHRPVEVYKNNEFIGTFKNVKEASIGLKMDNSTICKLLKGVLKNNRKGLTFKYI